MTRIEELTLIYWGVSSTFNGRPGPNLTTADAISRMGIVIENVGPKRKSLRGVSAKLLDEIIHGARKKRAPEVIPDNILKLAVR